MEQMREILRRIHDNGEMSFQPKDNSPAAVKEFQAIAKRIVAAHERGYLVNVAFRRSKGMAYVLHIIVTGGLTFEGEHFLESQQKESEKPDPVSTDKQSELIKWEPKLLGFKLEGNELIRRLQRWWEKRKRR